MTSLLGSGDPLDPDLPAGHLPYFYNRFPHLKTLNYASPLPPGACWGYEPECAAKDRFSRPSCPGEGFVGWTRSRGEAEQLFYRQADFGHVSGLLEESQRLCPTGQASQLVCGRQLQYCLGSNFLVDFRALVPRLNTESLR